MNWGHKIIAVYIVFVSGIIFLVIKSSVQKQDLVTNDYYEQELVFQKRIDATQRANSLSSRLQFEIKDSTLYIHFPQEMKNKNIKAQVQLYCVADETQDIEKGISSSNAEMQLIFPASNKGLHELKINWVANSTAYYFQQKLVIP